MTSWDDFFREAGNKGDGGGGILLIVGCGGGSTDALINTQYQGLKIS